MGSLDIATAPSHEFRPPSKVPLSSKADGRFAVLLAARWVGNLSESFQQVSFEFEAAVAKSLPDP